MIFVLELPQDAAPRAWFAYDGVDLLRKVAAADPLPLWQIHDRVTPRELLDMVDATPATPEVRQRHPALCALADAHGWDGVLYRADYLSGQGCYSAAAVSEAEAAVAALAARGPCRVYWSESEATAAFERICHPDWQGGGWRARHALREQLLALEVLADDL